MALSNSFDTVSPYLEIKNLAVEGNGPIAGHVITADADGKAEWAKPSIKEIAVKNNIYNWNKEIKGDVLTSPSEGEMVVLDASLGHESFEIAFENNFEINLTNFISGNKGVIYLRSMINGDRTVKVFQDGLNPNGIMLSQGSEGVSNTKPLKLKFFNYSVITKLIYYCSPNGKIYIDIDDGYGRVPATNIVRVGTSTSSFYHKVSNENVIVKIPDGNSSLSSIAFAFNSPEDGTITIENDSNSDFTVPYAGLKFADGRSNLIIKKKSIIKYYYTRQYGSDYGYVMSIYDPNEVVAPVVDVSDSFLSYDWNVKEANGRWPSKGQVIEIDKSKTKEGDFYVKTRDPITLNFVNIKPNTKGRVVLVMGGSSDKIATFSLNGGSSNISVYNNGNYNSSRQVQMRGSMYTFVDYNIDSYSRMHLYAKSYDKRGDYGFILSSSGDKVAVPLTSNKYIDLSVRSSSLKNIEFYVPQYNTRTLMKITNNSGSKLSNIRLSAYLAAYSGVSILPDIEAGDSLFMNLNYVEPVSELIGLMCPTSGGLSRKGEVVYDWNFYNGNITNPSTVTYDTTAIIEDMSVSSTSPLTINFTNLTEGRTGRVYIKSNINSSSNVNFRKEGSSSNIEVYNGSFKNDSLFVTLQKNESTYADFVVDPSGTLRIMTPITLNKSGVAEIQVNNLSASFDIRGRDPKQIIYIKGTAMNSAYLQLSSGETVKLLISNDMDSQDTSEIGFIAPPVGPLPPIGPEPNPSPEPLPPLNLPSSPLGAGPGPIPSLGGNIAGISTIPPIPPYEYREYTITNYNEQYYISESNYSANGSSDINDTEVYDWNAKNGDITSTSSIVYDPNVLGNHLKVETKAQLKINMVNVKRFTSGIIEVKNNHNWSTLNCGITVNGSSSGVRFNEGPFLRDGGTIALLDSESSLWHWSVGANGLVNIYCRGPEKQDGSAMIILSSSAKTIPFDCSRLRAGCARIVGNSITKLDIRELSDGDSVTLVLENNSGGDIPEIDIIGTRSKPYKGSPIPQIPNGDYVIYRFFSICSNFYKERIDQ